MPNDECDLVMKGGITSGIVYPKAAVELSKSYRFRGIGGSSAGAIAAAGTAAAELGRSTGGFDKLDALCEELAKPDALLNLFQPTRATRPVMRFGLAFLNTKLPTPVFLFMYLIAWNAFTLFLVGAVVAMLIVNFRLFDSIDRWYHALIGVVVFSLLFAMALTPFLIYFRVTGWMKRVRRNHLGVCTGMPGVAGRPDQPALTPYLCEKFRDLAGLPENGVLTFGQLKGKKIDLKLMTSCLSIQRPYVFPLRDERFLFNEVEWKAYYPQNVLDVMKANAPQGKDYPTPPSGYYYLPHAEHLPVIVPVRISMSFPVLFSAIPLYTFTEAFERKDDAVLRPSDLKLVYFSDGGIVSNFPIHIFDKWLPDCPTFGINLAKFNQNTAKSAEVPLQNPNTNVPLPAPLPNIAPPVPTAAVSTQSLVVPTSNKSGSTPQTSRVHLPKADEISVIEWNEIQSFAELAAAVFYTAKNHRDTAQTELPSYKERVVTVRLDDTEGGFNLNMSSDIIRQVMGYGTAAGQTMVEQYSKGEGYKHHQWVRLRVVLARLEDELCGLRKMFGPNSHFTAFPGENVPFQLSEADWEKSHVVLDKLWEFVDANFPQGKGPFTIDPPEPLAVKRFVPAEGGEIQ